MPVFAWIHRRWQSGELHPNRPDSVCELGGVWSVCDLHHQRDLCVPAGFRSNRWPVFTSADHLGAYYRTAGTGHLRAHRDSSLQPRRTVHRETKTQEGDCRLSAARGSPRRIGANRLHGIYSNLITMTTLRKKDSVDIENLYFFQCILKIRTQFSVDTEKN